MNQRLALISILIDDYDEAIAFYVGKTQFHFGGRYSHVGNQTLGSDRSSG
jgi:catechol 2,3-dioxygenase-like lactoylglutathione lyase family enzyme